MHDPLRIPYCPTCAYHLADRHASQCPECGTHVDPDRLRAAQNITAREARATKRQRRRSYAVVPIPIALVYMGCAFQSGTPLIAARAMLGALVAGCLIGAFARPFVLASTVEPDRTARIVLRCGLAMTIALVSLGVGFVLA